MPCGVPLFSGMKVCGVVRLHRDLGMEGGTRKDPTPEVQQEDEKA